MSKYPAMTEKQWQRAQEALPPNVDGPRNDGEVCCILDALDSGDDPYDALCEWRHWRSPVGRRQEAFELFESGHPMGDHVRLD